MSSSRRSARSRRLAWVTAVAGLLLLSGSPSAQTVRSVETNHLTVGATLGLYPMGGGFGLGEQGFDYQGVHIDAVRLGFAQKVSRGFRMELAVLFGLSILKDPGYVPAEDTGESGSSRVGYHWGFGIDGYYRFPVGLTLGLGGEITFGFGEFLDTAFFRAVPAIGWEITDALEQWFLHVRWVFGVTLLNGLEELNAEPESSLSYTGVQVVYGF